MGSTALARWCQFFPLVIALQPFKSCLVVESNDIAARSSNSETEVRNARIALAPSCGLHYSPPASHCTLAIQNHLCTTNVSSWIPLFSPNASGVRVARMMISAEWALQKPQTLCDRPQSDSSPKLPQLRVGWNRWLLGLLKSTSAQRSLLRNLRLALAQPRWCATTSQVCKKASICSLLVAVSTDELRLTPLMLHGTPSITVISFVASSIPTLQRICPCQARARHVRTRSS